MYLVNHDFFVKETRSSNGPQRSKPLILMANLMDVALYFLRSCGEFSDRLDDVYDILRLNPN